MKVKITGTGSCLPKLRVTNDDLGQIMETSDEWIRSRTGIIARHIAVEETTTGMSTEAAGKALKNAEISVAFDINAACSGFLFALDTAALYLEHGGYQHALVIGAETLSKMMDWTDRSTCVLFGDGAGAAVLSVSEEDGILSMVQGSDGFRGDVLNCMARKVNNPYKKNDMALSYVSMNGQEVYRFAVKTVPKAVTDAVERAGLHLEEIDLFLLHQANYRIIEAVSKRLGQPMEKFPTNLEECGNISAASVPILLDNVNNHGMMRKGMKIVLAGFGAGLTWGATVINW